MSKTTQSLPLNVARDNVIKGPVFIGSKAQIAAAAEAALVETFAMADQLCKVAERQKKEAREALLKHFAATGRYVAKCDRAVVTLKSTSRAALDTAAIRVEMGEAWCDARSKVSDVQTLGVTWLSV